MEVSYKARPFKIALNDQRFKGIVATNLKDLKEVASKSLGLEHKLHIIDVSLAEDNTIIDNEEYFSTLLDNTKLLITINNDVDNTCDVTDFPVSHEQSESQEIDNCDINEHHSLLKKLTTANLSECMMSFLTMSNAELEYISNCNHKDLVQAISKPKDVVHVFIDNANRELLRRQELLEATQLLNMFERVKKTDGNSLKRKKL